MPMMVFHLPFAYDKNATAAPKIRPYKMIQAFRDNGWEVIEVVGPRRARKAQMLKVKKYLESGGKIDFAYSECATTPTTLIEPGHFPLVPFLDFRFFRLLRKHNIPIGLFYRDVYWRLDDYRKDVPWWALPPLRALFKWDLINYRKYLRVLYLPTLTMGEYLPIFPPERMNALPPGCNITTPIAANLSRARESETLQLLYVGALGTFYRIDTLLDALHSLTGVHLTVCVPEGMWEKYLPVYGREVPANVTVVQASGEKLAEIYRKTDLAMLFMEPNEFRQITLPVKLFEALGWGCPLVCSEGSMAGKFVAEKEVGWTIPCQKEALVDLLNSLLENRELLAAKIEKVGQVRDTNSWQARARQVEKDLLEEPK